MKCSPHPFRFYHSAPVGKVLCLLNANELFSWARACSSPLNNTPIVVRAPPNPETFLNWQGFWLAQTRAGTCRRVSADSMFSPAHTWIQVIRIAEAHFYPSPKRREGGNLGCWFFAAAGSGVFLNTGRTLRATNRTNLAVALNMSVPGSWTYRLDGAGFCGRAAALGYDTVQILDEKYNEQTHLWHRARRVSPRTKFYEHEIISCSPSCLDPVTRGPCTTLPLRTGLHAEKLCACDDRSAILNCDHTSRELPPAGTPGGSKGVGPSAAPNGSLSAVRHRRWCPVGQGYYSR
mmetsp:Transcript_68313/g.152483  ORF Transcript_68313/g.152483 Transcript_68313/m.152483 type:complete len:291 (+) Transcript_68313:394-1266(+)